MSGPHPFLAVPIKARISSQGGFVFADPPIWRLHFLAGGEAETGVAVPELAALASLSLRTRMRIQQPVRAADEDSDVELWVEATPQESFVDIEVTGWREVTSVEAGFRSNEIVHSRDREGQDDNRLMIDGQLRIVQWPTDVVLPGRSSLVGEHMGSVFVVQIDDNGAIPLFDRLVERREISGEKVRLIGDIDVYHIELSPIFARDGGFLGHGGSMTPVTENGSSSPSERSKVDLPMGRQFASVLQQPLSRIVANAETIGGRLHGPLRDNYTDYARDIANAARHLSELVSDMEDLEAIDRPDFSVARDRIELTDVASRVAGLLALKAADHGIKIQVPNGDEKLNAVGEFRRVLQILLNLVGNAIRYAPGGSTVTIKVEKLAGDVSLTVSDQGQGIAASDREKVFEKFERLGRSGDGGSGLGLYISRRLARAMDGDLVVEDAPEGGALFRLTLPAR